MSMDNGIYILQLKDQARVIHDTDMDSLCWSFLTFSTTDSPVPTRVVEKFVRAEPMTIQEARNRAFRIETAILTSAVPVIEHGIRSIKIDKTWRELLTEAKALAVSEIECMDNKGWTKDMYSLYRRQLVMILGLPF